MKIRSTTVLAVVHNGQVAIGADGQASMGNTVAKTNVRKIRKLLDGKIVTGFAGSTADAFTLLERFEEKLNAFGGNMKHSAIELAKDWRTDRYLRKLEAMMIVADKEVSLLLSGTGDVIESDDGILSIGSGGPYANSAAKALLKLRKSSQDRIYRITSSGREPAVSQNTVCNLTQQPVWTEWTTRGAPILVSDAETPIILWMTRCSRGSERTCVTLTTKKWIGTRRKTWTTASWAATW